MHPAVLTPQSAHMMPYPMFQSPLALRQFEYHPMMFPFQHQIAMHAHSGAFQYALAGLPCPLQPHILEGSPKSSKRCLSPNQSRSSFSIDAILSTRSERKELSSPEGSPVCGKFPTNSAQRKHERLKSLALPYSRPAQTRLDFLQSPRSGADLTINALENSDKKSRCGDWGKSGRSKRVRTIFTPEQLDRLETEFERQQYMVGTERYYLATELNLTEAQVKVWFQNRRIKWRKQTLEKQHAQLAASDVYHSVESDSEDIDDENNSAVKSCNDKDSETESSPKPLPVLE